VDELARPLRAEAQQKLPLHHPDALAADREAGAGRPQGDRPALRQRALEARQPRRRSTEQQEPAVASGRGLERDHGCTELDRLQHRAVAAQAQQAPLLRAEQQRAAIPGEPRAALELPQEARGEPGLDLPQPRALTRGPVEQVEVPVRPGRERARRAEGQPGRLHRRGAEGLALEPPTALALARDPQSLAVARQQPRPRTIRARHHQAAPVEREELTGSAVEQMELHLVPARARGQRERDPCPGATSHVPGTAPQPRTSPSRAEKPARPPSL